MDALLAHSSPRHAAPVPRRRGRNFRLVLAVILLVFLSYYFFASRQWAAAFSRPAPGVRFVPSSRDWSTVPEFYPPPRIKGLPSADFPHRRPLPAVQAPSSAFKDPTLPDPRRESVLEVFQRSYDAYKEHAWLEDELSPVSGGGKRTLGGWAATLVDTLDTLWIMNLTAEFHEASTAIGRTLDFAATKDRGAANMFEVTIRHLGGLLSAYDLSGDDVLLAKAVELGELLYMGFDTPNRMPVFWLDLRSILDGSQHAISNGASAAGTSLSLEFTRLSQITGDSKFYAAADRVTRFLEKTQGKTRLPGLWPRQLDLRGEDVQAHGYFSLGAQADSLYEYLPKMHALMGGIDPVYMAMYTQAAETALEELAFRPMLPEGTEGVLFLGDAEVKADGRVTFLPESQHLSCFAGGMFGLGGRLLGREEHVDIGERLARGCAWAYSQFPTGVMPEIFGLLPCSSTSTPDTTSKTINKDEACPFDEARWRRQTRGDTSLAKGWRHIRDPQYMLRPEAIESLFLLYRMTGKEDLRDLAWDMFQGIVGATETAVAYSAIRDVRDVGETTKSDSMEVS